MGTTVAFTKLGQQGNSETPDSDSVQANLNLSNNDVSIGLLCDFGKTLYFSFRKDYVNQILAARLSTGTNYDWT